MSDPTGAKVITTTRTTSDTHTYHARYEGKHTYCFGNEFSTVSDKKVGFNVHENFQKVHDSVKGIFSSFMKEAKKT
jgi:hypothetical protein